MLGTVFTYHQTPTYLLIELRVRELAPWWCGTAAANTEEVRGRWEPTQGPGSAIKQGVYLGKSDVALSARCPAARERAALTLLQHHLCCELGGVVLLFLLGGGN